MADNNPHPLVDLSLQGHIIAAAWKNDEFRGILASRLKAEDFIGEEDRVLYNALAEMSIRRNSLIFHEMVTDAARERFQAITMEFLVQPDPLTYREWIGQCIELSEKRLVGRAMQSAVRRLEDAPVDTVYGEMMSEIADGRTRTQFGSMRGIAEVVRETKDIIKRAQKGEEHIETVPTCFGALDEKLDGMERGHVTTLAGASGQGKTQAALQIARNVALWAKGRNRDSVVIIFSAEMTATRLAMRLASSATGVSTKAVRGKKASETEAKAYFDALDMMATLPIVIDETAAPTTDQMMAKVEMESWKHKDGVDLVVFDYIELAGDENGEREEARIGTIMRGLKKIARHFFCPVLALSQLNRESEKRASRMPQLDDIRSSGWVRNLSQAIVFLTRPDAYKDATGKYETSAIAEIAHRFGEGAAIFNVAKNRDGNTGYVAMKFTPGSTQFSDKAKAAPGIPDDLKARADAKAAQRGVEMKDLEVAW